MTYLFKSKATADVLMLRSSGDQLLQIIGKGAAAQGIIEPADMPAAMAAIEQAIAQEDAQAQTRPTGPAQTAAPSGLATGPEETVSLRQRAWPLLEMLRSAHAAAQPVVWGV